LELRDKCSESLKLIAKEATEQYAGLVLVVCKREHVVEEGAVLVQNK
jgi:hypothetical protein